MRREVDIDIDIDINVGDGFALEQSRDQLRSAVMELSDRGKPIRLFICSTTTTTTILMPSFGSGTGQGTRDDTGKRNLYSSDYRANSFYFKNNTEYSDESG